MANPDVPRQDKANQPDDKHETPPALSDQQNRTGATTDASDKLLLKLNENFDKLLEAARIKYVNAALDRTIDNTFGNLFIVGDKNTATKNQQPKLSEPSEAPSEKLDPNAIKLRSEQDRVHLKSRDSEAYSAMAEKVNGNKEYAHLSLVRDENGNCQTVVRGENPDELTTDGNTETPMIGSRALFAAPEKMRAPIAENDISGDHKQLTTSETDKPAENAPRIVSELVNIIDENAFRQAVKGVITQIKEGKLVTIKIDKEVNKEMQAKILYDELEAAFPERAFVFSKLGPEVPAMQVKQDGLSITSDQNKITTIKAIRLSDGSELPAGSQFGGGTVFDGTSVKSVEPTGKVWATTPNGKMVQVTDAGQQYTISADTISTDPNKMGQSPRLDDFLIVRPSSSKTPDGKTGLDVYPSNPESFYKNYAEGSKAGMWAPKPKSVPHFEVPKNVRVEVLTKYKSVIADGSDSDFLMPNGYGDSKPATGENYTGKTDPRSAAKLLAVRKELGLIGRTQAEEGLREAKALQESTKSCIDTFNKARESNEVIELKTQFYKVRLDLVTEDKGRNIRTLESPNKDVHLVKGQFIATRLDADEKPVIDNGMVNQWVPSSNKHIAKKYNITEEEMKTATEKGISSLVVSTRTDGPTVRAVIMTEPGFIISKWDGSKMYYAPGDTLVNYNYDKSKGIFGDDFAIVKNESRKATYDPATKESAEVLAKAEEKLHLGQIVQEQLGEAEKWIKANSIDPNCATACAKRAETCADFASINFGYAAQQLLKAKADPEFAERLSREGRAFKAKFDNFQELANQKIEQYRVDLQNSSPKADSKVEMLQWQDALYKMQWQLQRIRQAESRLNAHLGGAVTENDKQTTNKPLAPATSDEIALRNELASKRIIKDLVRDLDIRLSEISDDKDMRKIALNDVSKTIRQWISEDPKNYSDMKGLEKLKDRIDKEVEKYANAAPESKEYFMNKAWGNASTAHFRAVNREKILHSGVAKFVERIRDLCVPQDKETTLAEEIAQATANYNEDAAMTVRGNIEAQFLNGHISGNPKDLKVLELELRDAAKTYDYYGGKENLALANEYKRAADMLGKIAQDLAGPHPDSSKDNGQNARAPKGAEKNSATFTSKMNNEERLRIANDHFTTRMLNALDSLKESVPAELAVHQSGDYLESVDRVIRTVNTQLKESPNEYSGANGLRKLRFLALNQAGKPMPGNGEVQYVDERALEMAWNNASLVIIKNREQLAKKEGLINCPSHDLI